MAALAWICWELDPAECSSHLRPFFSGFQAAQRPLQDHDIDSAEGSTPPEMPFQASFHTVLVRSIQGYGLDPLWISKLVYKRG